MIKKDEKLQIRNSTAEFLIFTTQSGADGIEVRYASCSYISLIIGTN